MGKTMVVSKWLAVACMTVGAVGCGAMDPGAMHSGGTSPGGTTSDANEGTSCKSDSDCAGGYACQGASSKTNGCTPNRPCTADECTAICLAQNAIDLNTGQPTAACLADCQAHTLCCSGSGQTTTTSGKCHKTGGGNPNPGPGSSPDAGTQPAPAPLAWAGTWSVSVSYSVSCDFGFGNVKRGTNSHTLTMTIDGANSSLNGNPQTPTSGWNQMSGTGDENGMTLSGPFPFRDHGGTTVENIDNSVTLKITSVSSSKQASGTIEGTAKQQFGAKCTLSDGSITLTR